MSEEYRKLGVDARKKDVIHFKGLIDEEFPHAFTPLLKDPDRDEYFTLHVDGAGSKPIISYLYYKEFGELGRFRGLAQDVVAMNLDDVMAVGAEPVAFADYIAINPHRLPKSEVLRELSLGFKEVFGMLSTFGKVRPRFSGGETADLPDQVRTLDVVGILYARVRPGALVKGEVRDKALIVGLRSGGRAKYEDRENSGIMCNGLTLARHVLLSGYYKERYPEVCEPSVEGGYRGRYRLDSYVDELGMSVGEALLSPTRIFAPVVAEVMERCGEHVRGMVHVTGGGLTKFLQVGSGLRYVLDGLPEPDPIFDLIRKEGRIDWREMYEVFNMGMGFGIMVDSEIAEEVISISEKHGVGAKVIGFVERSELEKNTLVVKRESDTYLYSRDLAS